MAKKFCYVFDHVEVNKKRSLTSKAFVGYRIATKNLRKASYAQELKEVAEELAKEMKKDKRPCDFKIDPKEEVAI